MLPWLAVAVACLLDRLIGDPPGWLHPVQVMGWWIAVLRQRAEAWAGDQPWRLRLAGGLITVLLVGGSGGLGWALESLARSQPLIGQPLLLLALASCLAGESLDRAVRGVLAGLAGRKAGADKAGAASDGPSEHGLERARARLAWIVGRDVENLDGAGILRAAAETAAENGVDGLFAPLFWMLVGAGLGGFGLWGVGLWGATPNPGEGFLPGPLTLAWAYKASSTLDSMLGYRRGRLQWLGTAGARLDDLLTWLPCRFVALSLPLVSGRGLQAWGQVGCAFREGRSDPSPNAGLSQAAYAQAAQVQLGGVNHYRGERRLKPLLGVGFAAVDQAGVERILSLNKRLEVAWLLMALALALLADRVLAQ
ncbi:adenosylcobinamide-phosphate synthase CbiB [Synechococcus sp. CS-602]|nr:adenosylcobinamide-phosphate synthase CbiB [Synechococcus sp. CS-603]MCT0203587.1 adenosylcobinamide-phosphate synthase CbiB [Synechococcus sp. CS-602]MCT0246032.1 adenosylcobinamide-phosphate synthase CbiB [Synechococcus sp. CS-601]